MLFTRGMRRAVSLLALGGLCLRNAEAQGNKRICPVQGQQFPPPIGLASDDIFQNATRSIEASIKSNLTQLPFNETSFSLGMFSTSDENLLYAYHHTDASVASSQNGTNAVGADSIYRIASISKILTVYMWLIRDGDRRFNDPITDFIPELTSSVEMPHEYATPAWSELTVGDLAMYLAGIARDYALNEVAIPNYVTSVIGGKHALVAEQLPNNPQNGIDVPSSFDPHCGYLTTNRTYIPCATREAYLQGIVNLAAAFPSGYTPLYSNANFALLSMALANLADMSVEELFDTSIANPLHLNGTTIANPQTITERSVIPFGDPVPAGWNDHLGALNGAAGAFSTLNDLSKIGRSILNATLASQAVTRRWFSTVTFVDTIDQAVGRGWEIFRQRIGGHTVDLFTKSGYWGYYTSVIFLIPEYNFGFTLLTASANATGSLTGSLPNLIIDRLLPALEMAAKRQAQRNFAGVYTSNTSNSSITIIATDDDRPALRVTEYIVDGIDLMDNIFSLFGKDIDFRLVPNQLYKGNQIGFTGVYQPPSEPLPQGEFYWPCQSWLDIDDYTYASVPLGHIVFEVDDSGRACNIQLKAFRKTLQRNQLPFLDEHCQKFVTGQIGSNK